MNTTLTVTLVTALALGVPFLAASDAAPMAPAMKSTPLSDLISNDPAGAIFVPAGNMLEGRVTASGFQFMVVPIPQDGTFMNHGAGGTADCNNDILGGWQYPVSTNSRWPLRANAASAGQCKEELHTGPITLMQFRTSGDYYGLLDVYGDNGGISIGCTPAGSVLGAGHGDEWRTTFDGQDMFCYLDKWGAEPSEFNEWRAHVTNYHFESGSTFASFN